MCEDERVPLGGLPRALLPVPEFARGGVADSLDELLRDHDHQLCACYSGYRSQALEDERQARALLTEHIQSYMRKNYHSESLLVREQLRVCAKRMLFQDVSCLLHALRYSGCYASGMATGMRMARTCYCPYVYPGLDVVLPSFELELSGASEKGLGAARASMEIVLRETRIEDLDHIVSVQASLMAASKAIYDIFLRVRRFFRNAYYCTEACCECLYVQEQCSHPCVFSDEVARVPKCLNKAYIENCLDKAWPHLAAVRRMANRASRQCARYSRSMEATLMRELRRVLPYRATPTVGSLYRTRHCDCSCAFYEALRDMLKVNPCVTVQIREGSCARPCRRPSSSEPCCVVARTFVQ